MKKMGIFGLICRCYTSLLVFYVVIKKPLKRIFWSIVWIFFGVPKDLKVHLKFFSFIFLAYAVEVSFIVILSINWNNYRRILQHALLVVPNRCQKKEFSGTLLVIILLNEKTFCSSTLIKQIIFPVSKVITAFIEISPITFTHCFKISS